MPDDHQLFLMPDLIILVIYFKANSLLKFAIIQYNQSIISNDVDSHWRILVRIETLSWVRTQEKISIWIDLLQLQGILVLENQP